MLYFYWSSLLVGILFNSFVDIVIENKLLKEKFVENFIELIIYLSWYQLQC